jgi:hypothetical protein
MSFELELRLNKHQEKVLGHVRIMTVNVPDRR